MATSTSQMVYYDVIAADVLWWRHRRLQEPWLYGYLPRACATDTLVKTKFIMSNSECGYYDTIDGDLALFIGG